MGCLDTYNQVRSQIRSGDMLEWKSPGFVGGSIRLITGKEVNHTSLCLDLPPYGLYSEPHKFILEANPSGIQPCLISERLREFKGSVWWYKLKPEFDILRNDGIDWALEQVGTKYDYKSLLSQLFGSVSADSRKYFCSEYNFFYLVVSGILPQYAYNPALRVVIDRKTGKVIKAPVPGTFDKFGVYYQKTQILCAA